MCEQFLTWRKCRSFYLHEVITVTFTAGTANVKQHWLLASEISRSGLLVSTELKVGQRALLAIYSSELEKHAICQ